MLIPNIDIEYDISTISKRKIQPIFEEINNKDRRNLDSAVLKALGLDPNKYLDEIYKSIIDVVKERTELPKTRKKQQKQKVKVAYDDVKESVIKECIGDNVKKFPEYFYSLEEFKTEYDALEFNIHNTDGKPLRIEELLGTYFVKNKKGDEILYTNNRDIAEFSIYLAKNKIIRLKIPNNEKIVSNILKNYKNFIETLKQQIETNANNKLHKWEIAEKMTKEILDEYNLVLYDLK